MQFLAAALMVGDPVVFSEFVAWLDELLANRGVPPSALVGGLEALGPLIETVDPGAVRLLESARRELLVTQLSRPPVANETSHRVRTNASAR